MTVDPLYVWYYQDLDTGSEHVFGAEHLAMDAAERAVGNKAVAVNGDHSEMFYLYGPGDGSTRIMIRRWRRDDALEMGLDLPILD